MFGWEEAFKCWPIYSTSVLNRRQFNGGASQLMVKNITLSPQHCQHSTKMLTFIIAKKARSQSLLRQPRDTNKTLLLILCCSTIKFKHRFISLAKNTTLEHWIQFSNFLFFIPSMENWTHTSYTHHSLSLTLRWFCLIWLKSVFKTHVDQSSCNHAYLVPTETVLMSFLNVGWVRKGGYKQL